MAPGAPSVVPMGDASPPCAVSGGAAMGCWGWHCYAAERRQGCEPKQSFRSFLQSPWEGEVREKEN